MVSRKRLSEQEFLAMVRQYWSSYAVARETDGQGAPGRHVIPGSLGENTFYLFDAESMGAIRHAVEDLALEDADGTLLAAFPSPGSFEPHRERYLHLAATLDGAELILPSPLPRRVPHARFIKTGPGAGRDYWMTAYEGRRHGAMLVCRQAARSPDGDDQYEGFYTFNPHLIRRIRSELLAVVAGRLPLLREFHRLALISRVSQQIKTEFAREEEALGLAMQRLLLDGERYQASHFASDLERGLSRLCQWKERLPELLAGATQQR